MEPVKVRKKPVVVEAMQYWRENEAGVLDWINTPGGLGQARSSMDGIIIHTLEGDHLARPGDWIIKGVQGEFYPCKPNIFTETYEMEE